MEKKSYKILNSYAVIKSSWLEDDYISSFIPLFATLMLIKQYKKIEINEISKDFEIEYNIKIPKHPITEILNIMKNRKMISRSDIYFYPVQEQLKKYDIRKKSEILKTKQNLIFSEIVEFAKDNYNKEINIDTAQDMLYSYLQQNSALLLNNEVSINYTSTRTIIADYIKDIHEKDIDKFYIIKQIAIGKLLVEAISFNTKEISFNGLNIFLDTKYLLNIIGCYGDLRQEVFSELTKKLLEQKANLFVFSHTDEEMMYILNNAEKWIESTAFEPNKASSILRRLRAERKTKKDIQEFKIRKKFVLDSFNIKMLDKEEINNLYQIDEHLLEQKIFNLYKQQNPNIVDNIEREEKTKRTILYDIKSITNIYQQRKGFVTSLFQEAKSFLLTTNKTLVYASKIFHDKEFEKDTIPACITDSYISTLIWSINGIGKSEEIIEKKLISDCFFAMEPSQDAIDKYCSNIQKAYDNKKISESELVLLRSYGLATKAAKPITISPDDIEDKDIFDILNELERDWNIKAIHREEKLKKEIEDKEREIKIKDEKYNEIFKENEKYRISKSREDKINRRLKQLAQNKANKILNWIIILANFLFSCLLILILNFIFDLQILVNILLILIPFAIQTFLYFDWFGIKTFVTKKMIKIQKKIYYYYTRKLFSKKYQKKIEKENK